MPSVAGKQSDHSFRDFGGINTQANRQGIKENQFSWIENLIPIGPANAKVVPAAAASLATLTTADAYYSTDYTIGTTNYLFVATTDGAAYQVNESSGAVTTIAAAGTFSGTNTWAARWKNERILIIDSNANGYRDWDGATLTILSGTTAAPAGGRFIAAYAGRVWIVGAGTAGRTFSFSGPNSYTDFQGASAGGTLTVSDDSLRGNITALKAANNFLYFFGVSSINVISDVRVVGGITIFSNTNLSASIGTNQPQSVYPFYRTLFFANESGIYAQYGPSPTKSSDDLDGIFQRVPAGSTISAASVMLYNILCPAFQLTYADPLLGNRRLLLLFVNRKWFVCSQRTDLVTMTTVNVGGSDRLYGLSKTNVYRLLSNASSTISWKAVTPLWDEGHPLSDKQVIKVGVEVQLPGVAQTDLSISLDTEVDSVELDIGVENAAVAIVSNSGQTLGIVVSGGFVALIAIVGYALISSDIDNRGKYIGLTLKATTPQMVVQGLHLRFIYRAEW